MALTSKFKKDHDLRDPASLLRYFKQQNTRPQRVIESEPGKPVVVSTVLWQSQPLSEKQMDENVDWIRSYAPANLRNGHMTSVCDPFLILLSHLLDCDISHKYLNRHVIQYKSSFNHSKTVLCFSSNSGHFKFVCRKKLE